MLRICCLLTRLIHFTSLSSQMQGNINKQMTSGIDNSAVVVVFITSRYIAKVNGDGPNGEDDNCAPHLTSTQR